VALGSKGTKETDGAALQESNLGLKRWCRPSPPGEAAYLRIGAILYRKRTAINHLVNRQG